VTSETGRFRRGDRVRKSIDYRRVSRTAVRYGSAEFVVLVAPARLPRDPDREEGIASARPPVRRLGLTVSRKVGNAVARNHVKRRVREWFRSTRDELPADVEVVVIAKPGAAELDSAGMRESLQRALASAPRAQRRGRRTSRV
jgi:ribonuclease P protein component